MIVGTYQVPCSRISFMSASSEGAVLDRIDAA